MKTLSTFVVLVFCIELLGQTPTTSNTIDESSVAFLKAQNRMLQASLDQRNKELAALQAEVKALRAQLVEGPAAIATSAPATRPSAEKKIIVPFGVALPSKPLAQLGIGRAAKSDPSKVLRVISILGDDSVLVDNPPAPPPSNSSDQHATVTVVPADRGFQSGRIGFVDPNDLGTKGPAAPPTIPIFILEGIPTQGMVVGQHLPDLPFKVVSTRKVEGKTFFVAWPMVKEARATEVSK